MSKINFQVLKQMLPCVIGALVGVSFGTMLGWPSVTFPLLVDPENAPIFITWDQTALIAGFLMEGNIIGVGFSTTRLLGSKVGVLFSCCCQFGGWLAMYFAQNVPGIGVSRGLIGFGHGFALGQLRVYAQETCKPEVFQHFMQYLPLSINIGVVFIFIIGGFLDFRDLSLVCAAIPLFALIIFAAIPKKIYSKEVEKPLETIATIYQNKNNESGEDDHSKALESSDMGIIEAFKNRQVRNCMLLLFFLVFIAQYAGGPANIVYPQIIHMAAQNPCPNLSSIVYGFIFFFSSILALKYSNKFPRRPVMIGSSIICSGLLCLMCFYFYFLKDIIELSPSFSWIPLVLLSLYNFFHTTGLHMIPLLVISDKVPKRAKVVVTKFYFMHFSLSAVLSTKIFQVIFTYCSMHMAYVFLAAVALSGALIGIFVFKESINLYKIGPPGNCYDNPVNLKDENIESNNIDRPVDSESNWKHVIVSDVSSLNNNVSPIRENVASTRL